ncbi:MAG: hypothetical protein ACFFDN_22155 [Candidatus Hodarchaeota archaeon]
MNIFEILDNFIRSLNNTYLINSIIRSSIVLILGLIALIILYYVLPKKFDKITTDDLNSLSEKENIPLIFGIIGFYILGTTGYAYAISRLFNVLYSPIVSIWVNVSFLFITALCIHCYNNIKFGLVPIIIGWISAIGSFISFFLGGLDPTLGLILEIIILSFLISVGIWFLLIKMSNYAKKIIIIFAIFLIFYGTIKLTYFLLFISQIYVGFLEFLYILSPTFLDIICIFGPVTICFFKMSK